VIVEFNGETDRRAISGNGGVAGRLVGEQSASPDIDNRDLEAVAPRSARQVGAPGSSGVLRRSSATGAAVAPTIAASNSI